MALLWIRAIKVTRAIRAKPALPANPPMNWPVRTVIRVLCRNGCSLWLALPARMVSLLMSWPVKMVIKAL